MPAAPAQEPTTAPAAPAQEPAARAPAAARRAAATPKDASTETNTTCCFCIEIRVGVLVILFLQLIYYSIPALLGLIATAVFGAIGLILLIIMGLRFAFTCWGIYAATKRIGAQFKAFAVINMILWVVGLIADIFNGFIVWTILIDILLAYFAYVFWVYAGILERGNTAARGNVEAPVVAPVAPVARVVETNATVAATVADAAPTIALATEPVVEPQPVAPSAPPALAATAGNQ
ncbi:hypothetical protein AMAG_04503 [Allomyces macrogynus ATCC 38327]|uniref:Uncharacterized protein n=1 Tax=Allomyces macrogynus (strain ATCC 38327) TaxID=578462 RepID=A0A0L0S521_ALLM3|nr:hypothetical protein AMAG_04503 [Allomyces macrogynus ATCC 38327]|eukprot:KNE57638.1 hypothetical protein AMAG_04503 [Allomyces macrogynus ATCC 38327]